MRRLTLLAALAWAAPVQAAHYNILIYGPTESFEDALLTAVPHYVTVWSAAQWRAATQSDFEAFDVIVVGDSSCAGPAASDLTALYDTRSTWQPAILGHVVVSGLNPACHAGTVPEAEDWLIDAVQFAAEGLDTGLYIAGDVGLRDYDALDAWGTFDSEARSVDSVSIVSTSFSLTDGWTSADLSGWGDSVNTALPTLPSGWEVIVEDASGDAVVGLYERCDDDFDGEYALRCGGLDCDDTNSRIKPGATETCDGVDQDCDNVVDEDASDGTTAWPDADGDGYGESGAGEVTCSVPSASVTVGGDCDDSDAGVFPGAAEQAADGVDQDCDGLEVCYLDGDGDGYGAGGVASVDLDCDDASEAWVDGDCDDADASANPLGSEIAYDGIDQDCDGADLCDVDLDGVDADLCGGGDCDDSDPSVLPGATETWYDGVDQDCDGASDYDADGDGDDALAYGGGDCDDDEPTVYSGAPELNDGLDNDCNGFAEDDDSDGDGLSSEEELALGTDPEAGDTDGDGLSDSEELDASGALQDSDGDGTWDVFDTDDDEDGVPTELEIGDHDWQSPRSEPQDTDGDGTPDYLDDDSDADGVPDAEEGAVDTDGDGLIDAADEDSDGDGQPDADEAGRDSDTDGLDDRIDDDDDGDGIPSAEEAGADTDGDGTPDALDLDSDDDGFPDAVEGAIDTDEDGVPDFRDPDSDGDGVADDAELDLDSDLDGLDDRIDDDDDGDGVPSAEEGAVDTDEDGVPDYLDEDSDADGFSDAEEGAVDSDGDGAPDFRDLDSDDDGLPDLDEAHGDSDGDGLDDRIDDDDDGDGLPTWYEGQVDTDGDGVPDALDEDSDGDGVSDLDEGAVDSDCDGTPDHLDAADFDGPCGDVEWFEGDSGLAPVEDKGCASRPGAPAWSLALLALAMLRRRRLAPLLLALGCAGAPVDSAAPPALTEAEQASLRTMWPLPALPEDPSNHVADLPWAAKLGQFLFFDPRLSSNGEVSCATCHDPAEGWADPRRVSRAVGITGRHAPSVLNTGHDRWFFWDGRCDTLWCQALQPMEHPSEMNYSRLELAWLLHDDPELAAAYADTFGPLPDLEGLPEAGRPGDEAWDALGPEDKRLVNEVFVNAGKAIGAFERQVISRGSAFDAWAEAWLIGGEAAAEGLIPDEAVEGFKLFVGEARCILCHSGPNFSSSEFHNLGLGPREWLPSGDQGRVAGIISLWDNPFNAAGGFSDDPAWGAARVDHLSVIGEQEGQFRVPTLRSVTLTAPYMHGGHLDTLDDVLELYSEGPETPELGHRDELLTPIDLDDDERAALIAFLETLEGAPLDRELTEAPESPVW